jgi:hypothetical protein
MTGALVFSQVCIWMICRMKPRLWVSEEAIAAEADRYCRARLLSLLYWIPRPLFAVFSNQFTALGTLYTPVDDLFYPWFLVYYTVGFFGWIGAFFLFISVSHAGQLGGRLTGWWWQKSATPLAST